ncbi:hypothetical protein AZE42_08751, partial [Rhizopogon vesiculosus]
MAPTFNPSHLFPASLQAKRFPASWSLSQLLSTSDNSTQGNLTVTSTAIASKEQPSISTTPGFACD